MYKITKLVSSIYRGSTEENKAKCTRSLSLSAAYTGDLQRRTRPSVQDHQACQQHIPGIYRGEQGQVYKITKLVSSIYLGSTEENKDKCTRSLSLSAAYTGDLQRRTRPSVQDHQTCQQHIPGIYRGEQGQVYKITKLVSSIYLGSTEENKGKCTRSLSLSAAYTGDLQRRTRPSVQDHQTCQQHIPGIYRGEQGQVYKITKLVSGIYLSSTEENKGKCTRSLSLSAAYTGDLQRRTRPSVQDHQACQQHIPGIYRGEQGQVYKITKLVSSICRGSTEENKAKCTRSLSLSAAYTGDLQRRTRPSVQDHQTCQQHIPGIYRGEQGQVYKITKLVSGIYRGSIEENKGKCSRSLSLSAAYTGDLQRRTRPSVQDHQACQQHIPGIYRGEQGQVYKITKLVSSIYRGSTEENMAKCTRSPSLSAAYTWDLQRRTRPSVQDH